MSQKIRIQDFHPWAEIRNQSPKPLRHVNPHNGNIEEHQPIEEDGKVFYDLNPTYAGELLAANPLGRYHLISPAKLTIRKTVNMETEAVQLKAVKPLDAHPVGDKRKKRVAVPVAAPEPLRIEGEEAGAPTVGGKGKGKGNKPPKGGKKGPASAASEALSEGSQA